MGRNEAMTIILSLSRAEPSRAASGLLKRHMGNPLLDTVGLAVYVRAYNPYGFGDTNADRLDVLHAPSQ